MLGLPASPPPDGWDAEGSDGDEALGDEALGDGKEGDGKDGDDDDGDGNDGGDGSDEGEGCEGGDGSDGVGGDDDCGEPLLGGLGIGLGILCCWADGSVTTQPANTKPKATAAAPIADCLIDRFKCSDERIRLGRLIAISSKIRSVLFPQYAGSRRGGVRTKPVLAPRRRGDWRHLSEPLNHRQEGSRR